MRTTILMTPLLLLLGSGIALAQSGQGGYLGENPGKNAPAASKDVTKPSSVLGSGQGGYLGENAGKGLPIASQDPIKPPPERGSGQGGYLGMTPGATTPASGR